MLQKFIDTQNKYEKLLLLLECGAVISDESSERVFKNRGRSQNTSLFAIRLCCLSA